MHPGEVTTAAAARPIDIKISYRARSSPAVRQSLSRSANALRSAESSLGSPSGWRIDTRRDRCGRVDYHFGQIPAGPLSIVGRRPHKNGCGAAQQSLTLRQAPTVPVGACEACLQTFERPGSAERGELGSDELAAVRQRTARSRRCANLLCLHIPDRTAAPAPGVVAVCDITATAADALSCSPSLRAQPITASALASALRRVAGSSKNPMLLSRDCH